jgi:hypothetical protein
MSMEEDLGTLIRMLNPYTDGSNGSMDPHVFVPATPTSLVPAAAGSNTPGLWMEVDTHYADDWTFKGQPHKINKAVRIAYRWAKKDSSGNILYWVTDYLMIGYEGSNSG